MVCLPTGKRKDVILREKIKYMKCIKYIKCVNFLYILNLHGMED